MNKFFTILGLTLVLSIATQAQVLDMVSAKEIMPQVLAKAKSELDTGVFVTHIVFAGISYQGVTLRMDTATGKATGWLYRYYSPGSDSARFYIGVKIPIVGVQVISMSVDSLRQLIPVSVMSTELIEPWVDSPQAFSGSKSGGASSFFQSHADAKINLAVLVNSPAAQGLFPQGLYWFFQYISLTDTLNCFVHGETGQPFRCVSSNAPRITSVAITTARVGQAYSYTVKANGNSITFSLVKNPSGMTIDAATGAISWTPAQVGSDDVTVRATNSYGTDDQSFTITVQAAATAPKITSTPVKTAIALQQYTYQIVASGSPTPTFTLANQPAGMAVDAGRGKILWQPLRNQAGDHTIIVTAKNSAGDDTQTYTLTVMAPPLMTPIPNQKVKATRLFLDTAKADAFPAPRYSFDFAPTGMTIDTASGAMSWTPTMQQLGKTAVIIRATNSAGFDQANFDITVDDPNPVTTPGAPLNFTVGNSYPNPVSAAQDQSVFIPVDVRTAVTLTVKIFSILGAELFSYSTAPLIAGSHALDLSIAALHCGTYYFSVTDGSAVHRGAIVVIP